MMSLRKAIKEGLLGDPINLRASRNSNGPFESVRKLPEFRDAVLTSAPSKAGHINAARALAQTPGPNSARTSPPSVKIPPSNLLPKNGQASPARPFPRPQLPEQQPSALPAIPRPGSPAIVPADAGAPLVVLKTTGSGIDWGWTVLFLLLATLAGGAGFFLLPHFFR
jgi:hypothetical protein